LPLYKLAKVSLNRHLESVAAVSFIVDASQFSRRPDSTKFSVGRKNFFFLFVGQIEEAHGSLFG
jgi:hypothetical protein